MEVGSFPTYPAKILPTAGSAVGIKKAVKTEALPQNYAVVAQLDRATCYELVGWGFEFLRPRQTIGV